VFGERGRGKQTPQKLEPADHRALIGVLGEVVATGRCTVLLHRSRTLAADVRWQMRFQVVLKTTGSRSSCARNRILVSGPPGTPEQVDEVLHADETGPAVAFGDAEGAGELSCVH
jgi:hypothetical protein